MVKRLTKKLIYEMFAVAEEILEGKIATYDQVAKLIDREKFKVCWE